MNVVKGIIWTLVCVVALVLMVLGIALSPWGTRQALEFARSEGWIDYQSVSGGPLDDFELKGVSLTTAGMTLDADTLVLNWASDCLLRGSLCIDSLTGQGIHIALHPVDQAQPAEEKTGSGRIATPIPVDVRHIKVDDVQVDLATGASLRWNEFNSGVAFSGHTLTLSPTTLNGLRWTAPPATELATPAARPSDTNSETLPHPLRALDQDEATQRIELPTITLPINLDAPSLTLNDLAVDTGQQVQHIDVIQIALHARDQQINLQRLHVEMPQGQMTATADVTMADNYPVDMAVQGDWHAAPFTQQKFDLSLTGSAADLMLELSAKGNVPATLDAQADLLAPRLPFSLKAHADTLSWPFGEQTPVYVLNRFDSHLQGDLDAYQLTLDGQAKGPEVDRLTLNARGNGDARHFDWSRLAVTTPDGSISSKGGVNWASGIAAQANIDLKSLDIGALAPSLSGRLQGQGNMSFHQPVPGQWTLDIPMLDIGGTLQKRPFSMKAHLDGDSNMQWNVHELSIVQGNNSLKASGTLSDRYDLDARLDAPSLDTLMPSLAGALAGNVSLKGSAETPVIDATLDGQAIQFNALSLGALSLKAHTKGKDDPALSVDMTASDLVNGAQQWRRINTTLKGRLSQHRLALEGDARDGNSIASFNVGLDGRFNQQQQRYLASVTQLATRLSADNDIALVDVLNARIDLADSAATIDPFCLSRSQGGQLCWTRKARVSAQKGDAHLALRDIPMSLLNSFLPEGWDARGTTVGDINLAWSRAGTQWKGTGHITSSLEMSGKAPDNTPWQLPKTSATIDLNATQANARVQAVLDLTQAGGLTLTANVKNPTGDRTLSGELLARQLVLAPYKPLFPQIDTLQGQLNGRVGLAGTTLSPLLNGQMVLDQLKVQGAALPVELNDARLALKLDGDRGNLDGYLTSGDATWNLKGNAGWPTTGDWKAHVELDGRNAPLLAALPQYGRLRVAPNLTVDADPANLAIAGVIRIPWARIKVDEVPPAAVSPSSDEVIITREEAARIDQKIEQGNVPDWADASTLAQSGMDIDVNVSVIIGDDVTLEAYGLSTNLNGGLKVRQQRNTLQLMGDIDLENGQFKAYGQNLIIRTGKITFNGPPAEPYLNFEAIRNPDTIEDDVTAGLRVTGSASQPNVSVFSDPDMNETTALSYLLRGRAPDDSGGGNDDALTSALIGLSLSQSGRAIGSIGESFGVQDLSLDTAGSGDDSQVVVSGYLFKDLKVSYGVGMFSSIAELTLRYKLLQNLYLEAVSGSNQALDLLYTFSLGKAKLPTRKSEDN
ncbi:autotransporter assembly complex protein TamB [Larsenimonas rhizosphaerae]|uniref:Translocation/assembly module TamB n=1 Tax=Larsenimonas rhizosphaerae TaxID=2944682 RepID=A0AA41ZF38_9GAMM|nr:translocation/assembly module TamB domain-containing protein [Larsenimonas rhizosphaerae]MCM2130686.1 translocation/assembly module TamB [Larsenimonas rhizosphaerae]MCX2523390.1 translocation/assembly module TamB [Larsenimonas rhizosphaerae]